MAKILSKSGIVDNNVIESYHITQSIDAFTGLEAYDIYLSGSLTITGSISGTINNADTSSKVRGRIETGSSLLFHPLFGNSTGSGVQDTVGINQPNVNPSFTYKPSTNTLTVTSSYALTSSYSLNQIGYFSTNPPTFTPTVPIIIAGSSSMLNGSASIDFSSVVPGKTFGSGFFVQLTKSSNQSGVVRVLNAQPPIPAVNSTFDVRELSTTTTSSTPFHFLIIVI